MDITQFIYSLHSQATFWWGLTNNVAMNILAYVFWSTHLHFLSLTPKSGMSGSQSDNFWNIISRVLQDDCANLNSKYVRIPVTPHPS